MDLLLLLLENFPLTMYVVIYGLVLLLLITLVDRVCALFWNYWSFVKDFFSK